MAFVDVLEKSKDAQVALAGPITSAKEKMEIIDQLAKTKKLGPLTRYFLILIATKNRMSHLREICDAIDEVRLEAEGGVLGEVVSADPMGKADIDDLAKAFTQKLGKKVEFKVSEDPSLLAGVKVTVNGVTHDGTLKSQLNRLGESFTQ